MKNYQMYIDGAWVDAESGALFPSENPYTGKPWAQLPRATAADADRAVQAAQRAFDSGPWPKLSATARGHLLRRLGDLITQNAETLARTEVTDNGKLLHEMKLQIGYVAEFFHFYGGLADKIDGAVIPIDKPDTFNFTRREPLGVCVAITPWNSPLMLTANKLAPGLAAGNTFVVKPSEFTSASILELARLAEEAGFPKGVINVVTGFGNEVGAALVSHPLVAKIAFTGSESGGRIINETAATQFKRVTLELGGKSANIVFDDANLDHAVKGAIGGIFAAAGQTCVAGSRLLVQRTIYDRFVASLVDFARSARLGDPMHPDTQVGPIANPPQFRKVLQYIDIAKAEGARCVLGGGVDEEASRAGGHFVQPTVFTDVHNGMRIAQEEVFGPVLSCIPFDDEDDAIRIANDSNYGLAAGVWTSNVRRMLKMSAQLKAGTVWINMYRGISYMSPFGGVKRSGVGREHGIEAINDYLETKSVWIHTAEDYPNPFVMR